jgi:hypothetical protein
MFLLTEDILYRTSVASEQKLEVEKKKSGWIEGKILCWCCV